MVGEHPFQGAGHRVGPEEVVVESIVGVEPGRRKSSNEEELLACGFLPLARVQGQKLVNEVTSILVLHIRFQPLLHPPLASTRDLKLLKQIQSGDAWPHL